MITILLPFAKIKTCSLNVAIWYGTDPHISPGRRYYKLADAFQLILVVQGLPLVQVSKSFSRFHPLTTFGVDIDVYQVGDLRSLLIIAVDLQEFFMREIN